MSDAVGTPGAAESPRLAEAGAAEPGAAEPGAAEPGVAEPPRLAGPREHARPAALVELRDAVVVRGARPVLTIDHLAIADGGTLALVGPNGVGKSTLLLALASLIRLGSGTLLFRGMLVGRETELAYRRHIGLVLPDPLLLDTSVFANVAAGLRFRGVPSASAGPRVTEWLERLGVAHLRDRPARQISSGEAQRVSLARALVLEPDLLLLDEPFASVDAATRARLLDDLEGLLRETHVACVIVTHDLDEAVRLGDRMAVMVGGRIRQVDTPGRVLAAPIEEDVARFVGAETRLPGRVVSNDEGVAVVDVGGSHVEAVSGLQPGRSVLCCLRPEDVTLWRAGPQPTPAIGVSSARNQLTGHVSRMVVQGSLVRVSIDCGATLVASITRASAVDLGLADGATVLATFKASAVHLIPVAG